MELLEEKVANAIILIQRVTKYSVQMTKIC